MRTLLGPPAQAMARRGLALERGAMVTLRRDAYATPPGPTLGLAIGERTTYRPGAWLLDTFERAALGASYPAWGGAPGLTLGAGGVTAAVGPMGMATHPTTLPRDAWAAVVIGALSGDAAVGLLLRAASGTADGYRITATPTLTVVERLDAGVATSLASVATPWRAGEMLRAVWAWDRLQVYRDAIVVAQVTDAVRLAADRAGLVARRATGASATITAFLGGEARQEWLGAGLDLGDVQRVLGQPATFDLTLSNVAPMGGADRFAALLRHGLNTDGTYDLDRGAVRVLTVVDGQSPPLTVGVGVIDGVAEITEDRVRLACRGRDAFLTPRLAAGPVTYLPGPPPGGLTPLPVDPCAPSDPPVIEPGDPPAEPVDPPVVDGIGPEAPSGGGGGAPLLGSWVVMWDYTLETVGPFLQYVGSTTVAQIPDAAHAAAGFTDHEFFRPEVIATIGIGTTAEPGHVQERWLYRGPDIGGTHLVPNLRYPPGDYPTTSGVSAAYSGGTGDSISLAVTLARYDASGIQTESDLAALRPPNPGETPSPLPTRIETLRAWTMSLPFGSHRVLADSHITTNQFIGPQLLRIEVGDTWGSPDAARLVVARITTYQSSPDPTIPTLIISTSVDGTMLGAQLGT